MERINVVSGMPLLIDVNLLGSTVAVEAGVAALQRAV